MIRLDANTVELTDVEEAVHTVFNLALDSGLGSVRAAELIEQLVPGLDPLFYGWLRDEDPPGIESIEGEPCSGCKAAGTSCGGPC